MNIADQPLDRLGGRRRDCNCAGARRTRAFDLSALGLVPLVAVATPTIVSAHIVLGRAARRAGFGAGPRGAGDRARARRDHPDRIRGRRLLDPGPGPDDAVADQEARARRESRRLPQRRPPPSKPPRELPSRTAANPRLPLFLGRAAELDHRPDGDGDRHRLAGLRHRPPHDGREGGGAEARNHRPRPVRAAVPADVGDRLDGGPGRPALDRPRVGRARARLRRRARLVRLESDDHA